MSEKVSVADIQKLFDTCGIEWVDQDGARLHPVVEQLSDGVFVGYYRDPNAEWMDADRLGDTLDEAFDKACETCEVDPVAAHQTRQGFAAAQQPDANGEAGTS